MNRADKPSALLVRPNLTGKASPEVAVEVARLSDRLAEAQKDIQTVKIQANAPKIIDAGSIRASLQAGGTTPLSVNNMVGVLSQPQLPGGAVKLVTTFYIVQINDLTILADATLEALTVFLPPATSCFQHKYVIKRMNTGANLVGISSIDLIDGVALQSLNAQYDALTVHSDGTTFWITSRT